VTSRRVTPLDSCSEAEEREGRACEAKAVSGGMVGSVRFKSN
jgi:hypothetical protein